MFRSRRIAVAATAVVLCAVMTAAQKIVWSALEKPVADQIASLRQLPDDVRARVTEDLASGSANCLRQPRSWSWPACWRTRFKDRGLVVLAISDEDAGKVKPFIAARDIQFPVLLDPGRKVNELFQIEEIPKSFVYDRGGKLVAQSIDMRTMRQFQEMLSRVGLE